MLVRGAWDRLLAPFLDDRTLSQDLAGHTLAWGVGWRGRGGLVLLWAVSWVASPGMACPHEDM